MKHILGTLLVAIIVLITGCKKEIDYPPVEKLEPGQILTIDSVRNLYSAVAVNVTGRFSVYGIVTADETSANLYKELYIQDETNAIKLDLTSSSNFVVGDKVRVALKGTTINRDNNMLVIENVDPYTNIVKQESGLDITPELVTITNVNSLVGGIYSAYQGKLVQINNLEFQCSEMCKTWADPIGQFDENRYLDDTLGNTILIRTSGYADFAGAVLPSGQGSVIAVVSQYGSTVQLTIRNPNELSLYGTRKNTCPFISKDFDDQSLTSCGWITKLVYGETTSAWDIYAATNSAAKISNYNPTTTLNDSSEAWLISPSMDLSATTAPTLNFRNVVNFAFLPQLEVLVSTNYDGISNPNTATWTDLTSLATWCSTLGWSNWTSSGAIDLIPYRQPSTYIAFRLIGTTASSATWELDDVVVADI